MRQSRVRKVSLVLFLVMVFSLFATSVYARQSEDPTVNVFRINRLYVLIKITFPTEISGNFAGTLAGKHFDCVTVPPSTLICIGPFRYGPEAATLTIYDQDTKENFFEKVIKSPPAPGTGDETPEPKPTEEPSEEPSEEIPL